MYVIVHCQRKQHQGDFISLERFLKTFLPIAIILIVFVLNKNRVTNFTMLWEIVQSVD